ncbi:MAG: hypothetical protein JO309_05585 [Pseudonocardiales bacterium]|nr:hypothetical protein [Pseudonocardiales bacterium]MBV9728871.1 hypothetical protein [Pseudonocardiales bacterium]
MAPAIAVNGHPARAADADALVAAAREGALGAAQPAPSGRHMPWPNDPYVLGEPRYQVLRALLTGSVAPAEVISTLIESGLRGMGGAGFPTGKKWELVAAQPGAVKYAICNGATVVNRGTSRHFPVCTGCTVGPR